MLSAILLTSTVLKIKWYQLIILWCFMIFTFSRLVPASWWGASLTEQLHQTVTQELINGPRIIKLIGVLILIIFLRGPYCFVRSVLFSAMTYTPRWGLRFEQTNPRFNSTLFSVPNSSDFWYVISRHLTWKTIELSTKCVSQSNFALCFKLGYYASNQIEVSYVFEKW